MLRRDALFFGMGLLAGIIVAWERQGPYADFIGFVLPGLMILWLVGASIWLRWMQAGVIEAMDDLKRAEQQARPPCCHEDEERWN